MQVGDTIYISSLEERVFVVGSVDSGPYVLLYLADEISNYKPRDVFYMKESLFTSGLIPLIIIKKLLIEKNIVSSVKYRKEINEI